MTLANIYAVLCVYMYGALRNTVRRRAHFLFALNCCFPTR